MWMNCERPSKRYKRAMESAAVRARSASSSHGDGVNAYHRLSSMYLRLCVSVPVRVPSDPRRGQEDQSRGPSVVVGRSWLYLNVVTCGWLSMCVQVPESVLAGQMYHASDVHQWTTDISSQCLKQLKAVASGSAGFKYIGAYAWCAMGSILTGTNAKHHVLCCVLVHLSVCTVNCTILQKRNAGFHTNSSCFWDAERDGELCSARMAGSSRPSC